MGSSTLKRDTNPIFNISAYILIQCRHYCDLLKCPLQRTVLYILYMHRKKHSTIGVFDKEERFHCILLILTYTSTCTCICTCIHNTQIIKRRVLSTLNKSYYTCVVKGIFSLQWQAYTDCLLWFWSKQVLETQSSYGTCHPFR